MRGNLGKQVIKCSTTLPVHGSNDVIVCAIEPIEDIPYELIIIDWFPGGGELGTEPFHRGEVLSSGHVFLLLCLVEGRAKVSDLGTGDRGEHGGDRPPYLSRGGVLKEVGKELR